MVSRNSFSKLNKKYNFLDPDLVSLSTKSKSNPTISNRSSSTTISFLTNNDLNIMPPLLDITDKTSAINSSKHFSRNIQKNENVQCSVPKFNNLISYDSIFRESHNSKDDKILRYFPLDDSLNEEEIMKILNWNLDESVGQSLDNSNNSNKRLKSSKIKDAKKKKNNSAGKLKKGTLNSTKSQKTDTTSRTAKKKKEKTLNKKLVKQRTKLKQKEKKGDKKGMITKEELNNLINEPVAMRVKKVDSNDFMKLAASPNEGEHYLQLLKRLLKLSNSYINKAIDEEQNSQTNLSLEVGTVAGPSENSSFETSEIMPEIDTKKTKKSKQKKKSSKQKKKTSNRKKSSRVGKAKRKKKKSLKAVIKKPAIKITKEKKKKRETKSKILPEDQKLLRKTSSKELRDIINNAVSSYKTLMQLKQKYSGKASETVTLDQAMLLAHDSFLKILMDSLKKPTKELAESDQQSLTISPGHPRKSEDGLDSTTGSTEYTFNQGQTSPVRLTKKETVLRPRKETAAADVHQHLGFRERETLRIQAIREEGIRKRERRRQSLTELFTHVPELSAGSKEQYGHIGPRVFNRKSTIVMSKLKMNPCTLYFYILDKCPSYPGFLRPFEEFTVLKGYKLPNELKTDRRLIAIERYCKVRFLIKSDKKVLRLGLHGVIVKVLARKCEDIAKAMRCIEMYMPTIFPYIIFTEKICQRTCGQMSSIQDDDFYRRLRCRDCFKTTTADFMESGVVDSFQGPYWAMLKRFMEEKMAENREQLFIARNHVFSDRPMNYGCVEFL